MKSEKRMLGLMGLLGVACALLLSAFMVAGCITSEADEDEIIVYAGAPSPSWIFSVETDWVDNSATMFRSDLEWGYFNNNVLDSDLGGIDIAEINGQTLAFVVGRQSDSIFVVDPFAGINVLATHTVGPGVWTANPYDVQVVDETKAYVTRQGDDDIAIINPIDGSALGTIDLTGIATNADGLARPYDIEMAAGKVFVILQNLDVGFNVDSATVENGIVAVIDPATDAIETTFEIDSANPQRLIYVRELNQVLVASAGLFWGAGMVPLKSRSGLEAFSPYPPYNHRLIVAGDAADVDANIYDVAYAGYNVAFILATDATGFINRDRALKLNVVSGQVDPGFRYPAFETGNDNLSGIVVTPDRRLAIGDGTAVGITIINLLNGVTEAFLWTDYPPAALAVIAP